MGFVTITHSLAMKLMVQKGVGKLGIFYCKEFDLEQQPIFQEGKVTFLHFKPGKSSFI